jgi:hypothetical protein
MQQTMLDPKLEYQMTEKYYVEVNDKGTFWCTDSGAERKLHRVNGPAIEWADGGRAWYQNGKLHRLDGPAHERPNGYRAWYQNGLRHRIDGPAVEYSDGGREWHQNGRLHRLDGPAVESPDGNYEWWLNDVQHTEESWRAATQTAVELTVAEIESLLGKRIKIVK